MSPKEAAIFCLTSLIEQGGCSFEINSDGIGGVSCLYLNKENGRRCAAGVFIPLEQYDEDFENKSISVLLMQGLIQIDVRSDILSSLQYIHDSTARKYREDSDQLTVLNSTFKQISELPEEIESEELSRFLYTIALDIEGDQNEE